MRSLFLSAVLLVSGCATNSYLNSAGHGAFYKGDYKKAGELFSREISKTNTNKLLFNLDAGMSYFDAGDYETAIPYFLQAVKFWESKDYLSLTESAGSFVISQNLKTYIGEDYERVLIHVFLALSYAGLEKYEDARVEARRIDLLLKQMREQEKKNYTESAFARYLSAIFWEASGDWDSARIDYEDAFKIDPYFPGISADLLRSSKISQNPERYDFWKKKFKNIVEPKYDPKKSELIVFMTYGLSPVKSTAGGNTSLPILTSRTWVSHPAEVSIGSKHFEEATTILDINDLSRKFYEVKIKYLATRKLVGTAFKAGAGYAVGRATKSADLGILTYLALSAMDTTDLRGWNTLPAGIKMIKIPVDPGMHEINITVKDIYGNVIKNLDMGQKKFTSGEKVFAIVHEG